MALATAGVLNYSTSLQLYADELPEALRPLEQQLLHAEGLKPELGGKWQLTHCATSP